MSTITIIRKYKFTDVVMLTSLATIIENAITNNVKIIEKRPTWTVAFFQDILQQIDDAIETYIGVDGAKELRAATKIVETIQADTLQKLSFLKLQIEQDFKKDPLQKTEFLNQLGYITYYKDANENKSQDALIDLLYQFKKNATTALIASITSKGITASSINEIISVAETLKNANISQETFKSNRPAITNEAIAVFNNLYDDVIAIGKISAAIFKDDKALQQSFSFTKLSKVQQAAIKEIKAPKSAPPTK